jgi:sugar-specific transcriptional regulator TrmB
MLGLTMNIQESLQNLGLNDKQAKVYMALLELGQVTAYAVAERSGLKRPTVYVILEELRQKGLVLKIPHVKKQLFSAKPPDEFFGEAEERLRIARRALPELLAMTSGAKKPKTLYYEGEKGVRDFLDYGLEKVAGNEFVGFYAHAENISKELLSIVDEYNLKLKRKNIGIRGIAPEHPTLAYYRKQDKEYKRNMKIVPYDTYSANISVDVGPSFVRIFAPKDMQGVIIENPDIARTMKQIFEMVWGQR